MRTLAGILLLPLLSLGPASARAQACNPAYLPDCLIEPTSAGQDVAPYCFIPTLARGQNPANYAVTATDEDGACHSFQAFMRFDLPAGLLSAGKTVTFAALELPYAFSFNADGSPPVAPHPPVTIKVHRVTSNWTENAVTWVSKPSFDPSEIAIKGNITNYGIFEFDVTETVRAWAHGTMPNHGFAITSPNDRALGFNSWESSASAAQKPALYIVTGNGPAPAPVPAMPALWSAALVLAIATLFSSRLRRAR
jgi:hypothetical protein